MFRRAAVSAATTTDGRPKAAPWRTLGRLAGRAVDRLTLEAHALAVRIDRVPGEFGEAEPLDEADPKALRREWLRQLRLWADYNPEEVFAFKVGALVLGGALVILLVFIAAM